MGAADITDIKFGKSATISLDDGTSQAVDAKGGSGSFAILIGDMPVKTNTILVDHDNPSVNNEITV